MSALPIVVVVEGEVPAAVANALEGAGFLFRGADANDAAASVNGGWAELVVCGRLPGWPALAARVQTAGGAVVLWGAPPDPRELRSLRGPIEAAEDGAALVAAVLRTHAVLTSARANVGAEDDLRERAECAELVSRFAQSIAMQIDLPHVVEEAIARTRDLCDADGASLLLVDPLTGELSFDVVASAAAGTLQRRRLKRGQGIAGAVARTAEPLLIPDVKQSPLFDGSCDAESGFCTGSIIAVPLLSGGDLIGVLEAVRGEARNPFTRAHLRRLQELSPHISIALYNAQITARLRETQAQVLKDNAELEQRIGERTQQIARAKREWESTFDAISEPIAVIENFLLRRVNTAWAQRAGVDIRSVSGRKCHELLAGRSSPCPGCPIAEGKRGLDAEVRLLDETTHRMTAFALPTEGGAPQALVTHYQDVTSQRTLERKLRESERLASVGQLASGAAHEINNPMGFLTSNLRNLKEQFEEVSEALEGARHAAKLLAAGKTKEAAQALSPLGLLSDEVLEEGAEMLDDAISGARRVSDIVRALRELSRQQSVTQISDADVNASVSRAVRAELQELASCVTLELCADAPAAIDPLQLDQALGHLLKNARQAVDGAQGIRVRTHVEGDMVLLDVEDEGPGISPENVNRVFEPFFTTRGVGKGIGLGLTAAWGIVQRHGGHIDVHSEVGKGARFTLRLPRAQKQPAVPATLAEGDDDLAAALA